MEYSMTTRDLTTLAHTYRRETVELLEDQRVVDLDDIIARCTDGDEAEREVRATIYHNHLPKLESAGAISWDYDTDTISRGPRFSHFASNLDAVRGLVA